MKLVSPDADSRETEDTSKFIMESTMLAINDIVPETKGSSSVSVVLPKREIKNEIKAESKVDIDRILMPPPPKPPKPISMDDFELDSTLAVKLGNN
jgi:hypothetical protein